MCGRYIIRQQGKALREWERYGPPPFLDSYNVAPSQAVPIVRLQVQGASYAQMRWGLIPFFAHGEPLKYATINARIETVESAPSYRDAWRRGRRCLQLASGFYEWHVDARGRKAPWLITLADQDLFAFAALWEHSVRSDGSIVESCAHITLPANALMSDIHNGGAHPQRMPAILASADREVWLHGTSAQAKEVLKPYPAELMVAHEVSTQVNSVRNNFPALLQPVPQTTSELRFG
jgi:putative SOS response-associated peptidase YedK